MSDTNPSPHREDTTTVDELAARRAAKLGESDPQATADEPVDFADESVDDEFDDDFDDLYDEPYEDDLSTRRTASSAYDPDSLESDPDVEPVVADFDNDYLDDLDDDYR